MSLAQRYGIKRPVHRDAYPVDVTSFGHTHHVTCDALGISEEFEGSYLDTAIGEGLLTFPCDVNEKGLQVRAEVLRRLGIADGEEAAPPTTTVVHLPPTGPRTPPYRIGGVVPTDAQKRQQEEWQKAMPEPPTEPGPQWSEPIEQMSPERCYHIARALGYYIEVRSTFDGADRTYWGFVSAWNDTDQADGHRMGSEINAWRDAVAVAAHKCDKFEFGGGGRVDLTGLEVRG